METRPSFDALCAPDKWLEHIENLKTQSITTIPHAKILQTLIDEIKPLDFKALVFPDVEKIREELKRLGNDNDRAKELQRLLDSIKVSAKQYRILAVENILSLATQNRWGLCKKHEFIYLYNGAYWSEINKDEFQKFLGEAAEKMGIRWDNARDYQFRENLFKQFLATSYLPTPEISKDTVLINLQNGTFEITLHGTKLRPFDRSDFITYQLPFRYDPQAKAPIFEAYLNRVLPDVERQRVLSEYLGYVFIKNGSGILKEEKALILHGTGANGKSVFFEVVSALLGANNVSNFSLQSLTNDNGYFRAKLANKLVNYASEINSNLEASIFKQLVSGEPVEARLPYGEPFTLKQYAKLIFNCNELPKDVEHTNAYFRRFLIIPFDVTIPEDEQDKTLHIKIIENELSGVFNWVLQGLNRLLTQKKFSHCEAAQRAIEQYKIESNSVQMFLNENEYKGSPSKYKPIKDLYQEYRIYCNNDGVKPFKKQNFIKQLKELGIIVERGAQNQLVAFVESGCQTGF